LPEINGNSENQNPPGNEESRGPADLLVFGEVLFDCFPDGHEVLGGAPFNVAWTLRALGEKPLFCSAVGNDIKGDAVLNRMQSWGFSRSATTVYEEQPTGEVQVTLENGEPRYDILEPCAWDFIRKPEVGSAQLIYHGSLALRHEGNEAVLKSILADSGAKRFYDVNLRPPHTPLEKVKVWLREAAWVKLNLDELASIADVESPTLETAEPVVDKVRKDFRIDNILLTAGADGAFLKGNYGSALLKPAPEPAQIKDTVGAGDAFTAISLQGILNKAPADRILLEAGKFASRVCGLQGATTMDRTFYPEITWQKNTD